MFISTRSRVFDFNILEANISDIARALGAQPRYLGHTASPFPIAQHAVACMQLAKEKGFTKEYQFTALMHDAAEAYCGDLPHPIKKVLPDYRELISRVEEAIAEQYGYLYPLPSPIVEIDKLMYRYERRGLSRAKKVRHHASPAPPPPSVQKLLSRYWTFAEARTAFINAFREFRPLPEVDFFCTPNPPYPCDMPSQKEQTPTSFSPASSQRAKITS